MTGLRTLHAIDSLGPGGAERSLVELLVALAGRGLAPEVAVLAARPDDASHRARLHEAGVPVRVVGGGRATRVRRLRALLRATRPALVHTTLVESDVAARLAAWRTGIPVATSLVNTTYDAVRLLDPAVSRPRLAVVRQVDGWTARHLTSRFHAITEAVAAAAQRDLGVGGDRIAVIPRGRDARRLGDPSPARRAAARAALGLPPDAPVVAAVARQDFQKGLDVLLDAMGVVARAHPGVVLVHAGRAGGASAAVLAAAGRCEADGRLLGHREDVPDVLAAADVFAFPSRYEGLGGAVLEAMALALPVVASDLPAVAEVAERDASAVLVPPGDPAALAAALAGVLADPDRARALGQRGRAVYLARFTLDAVAPRMLAFFAAAAGTVPPCR